MSLCERLGSWLEVVSLIKKAMNLGFYLWFFKSLHVWFCDGSCVRWRSLQHSCLLTSLGSYCPLVCLWLVRLFPSFHEFFWTFFLILVIFGAAYVLDGFWSICVYGVPTTDKGMWGQVRKGKAFSFYEQKCKDFNHFFSSLFLILVIPLLP